MFAEARTVVASLWNVDDLIAGKLMSGFCSNLVKGEDKASALRKAKLTILQESGQLLPYILGLSNWFVGRSSLVAVCLGAATILVAAFLRLLPAYLDCLEALPVSLGVRKETYAAAGEEKGGDSNRMGGIAH